MSAPVGYQRFADDGIFSSYAELVEYLEETKTTREAELYRHGHAGNPNQLIGGWSWDSVVKSPRLNHCDFRKSYKGREFEGYEGTLSGTFDWVDDSGPRATDGLSYLDIGVITPGGQPGVMSLSGLMTWSSSGGSPVAGDGCQVGHLHPDDDFSGGGLMYSGTAWNIGIRIEDLALNDTSFARALAESGTSKRFSYQVQAALNYIAGLAIMVVEGSDPLSGEQTSVANHAGRFEPDGRLALRALRSSGAAELTLERVKFSYDG